MMDSRRTAAQKATCAPPVVTLGYHPMSTRLPPFAALRAFVAVGRAGGIRRAAEDLGLSHAIISRHLAALEQDVGEVLLNRRTGELTPSGATYYKRLSKAIQEMEGATEALRGGRHRELVIWCSAGLSLHWLARRLPTFAARHGLVVDLQSTDREPDFASGAVDGDIRYRPDSDKSPMPAGVRTQVLARPDIFPVASPELLGKGALGMEDLLKMPLIQDGPSNEWVDWLRVQGVEHPAPVPVARFGQAHLALAAARAGQGVALSNPLLAGEDLAAGRLVEIPFPRVTLATYHFRASASRWHDPVLHRFRQWLIGSFAS